MPQALSATRRSDGESRRLPGPPPGPPIPGGSSPLPRRQAGTLRGRQAQRRFAAIGLAAVALLAGGGLAGAGILGGRAPHKVQATLNSVWDGSDDSALAPTGEDARGVAFFDGDTLFESPGKAPGSVCLTVVAASLTLTPSTASGSCFAQPFEAAGPFGVITRKAGAGQEVFGRITHARSRVSHAGVAGVPPRA